MRTIIIYEDDAVLVIHKPAGFPVQTKNIGSMDCVSELKNYLRKNSADKKSQPYLGIVHRLDQPVEGIMVFAKNSSAAAFLSKQVAAEDDSKMLKCYEATVFGKMPQDKGELIDYLRKDNKTNSSEVVLLEGKNSIKEDTKNKSNPGNPKSGNRDKAFDQAKKSKLAYKVLSEDKDTQKLYIQLFTGRHHQIRVQLSHAGAPILGDKKYGSEESIRYSEKNNIKNVALKAVHLEFIHPVTKKKMEWDL